MGLKPPASLVRVGDFFQDRFVSRKRFDVARNL